MTKMPQTVVENHSSSLLTSEENAQVFRLSGNRCPTISTTVVQLFETQPPHHSQWFKKHTGVLCFIKDNIRKNYFFRVFNLQRNVMVWEHEMYNNIEYIESTPFLHVFEGEKGIVAFNFASVEEAGHMRHTVTHKIQMRKRKEEKRARQSLKLPHESETKQLSHFQQSLKAPSESDARQFNQSLKVSSESDSYVYKKSVTPEASAANRRRKITKDDISIPMDFKHISHVGWNPNSGFDVSSEDEHLKKFLKEAGVSEKQLQDKDTREFIYDFIDKHKVREAMAEVTPPAPLVPPRGPTRTPHARAAPPPPPGPGGGSLSNGPSRPPETPISRKPAPPPAPPMSINTGGSAPPAPPPPPPPPMGMPPPMGGESAPMPPPPPAAPMMDNSALMDSIRNGTSLRPVEERKSAASDDARGDLLSEIRKGHTLRPVNEREIRPSIPSPKNAVAGGNDLATALALALAERSKAIHSDDDDDEGSESSNDDWED